MVFPWVFLIFPGECCRSRGSRATPKVAGPGGAGGAEPGGNGEGAERREGTEGGDGSEAPWILLGPTCIY